MKNMISKAAKLVLVGAAIAASSQVVGMNKRTLHPEDAYLSDSPTKKRMLRVLNPEHGIIEMHKWPTGRIKPPTKLSLQKTEDGYLSDNNTLEKRHLSDTKYFSLCRDGYYGYSQNSVTPAEIKARMAWLKNSDETQKNLLTAIQTNDIKLIKQLLSDGAAITPADIFEGHYISKKVETLLHNAFFEQMRSLFEGSDSIRTSVGFCGNGYEVTVTINGTNVINFQHPLRQ